MKLHGRTQGNSMRKPFPPLRWPPGVGCGALLTLALLAALNLALFNDHLLRRYGAVFAAGRAMDKQLHVEEQPPMVLILGNSRVDNGLDPRTLSANWGGVSVFNHGVPGANARIMYGMVKRLEARGALNGNQIHAVILGLDESFLQADDSLGYVYFFGDRASLRDAADYRTWLGTWLPLWSYSSNLRQLREPEKALRFVAATFHHIAPVGGPASSNLGYRAGFAGGAQNEGQVLRQETLAQHAPDPAVMRAFENLLTLLKAHNIPVAVTLPPLLNRESAYLDTTQADGAYVRLYTWLAQQPVTLLTHDSVPRETAYFVNAGHLNDQGAQIYSKELAHELGAAWPWLTAGEMR